jgi:hypothetical protein
MQIDYKLIYSNDQAVTVDAASTNNVNLGAANLNIGAGTSIWLVVIITAGFGSSAETLTLSLYHSATDGSYAAFLTLPAVAASAMTLPRAFYCQPLPAGLKQYSQLYFDCSAGGLTTGTIFAALVLGGAPAIYA